MPKVRMPDGVVVAFPDDMPPEQIKSMIVSKFPQLGEVDAARSFRDQASAITQKFDQPAPEPSKSIFRRVDDAVRGAADTMTFGLADEIAAKMGSLTGVGGEAGNYDANLAAQRERDAQGGPERFAGQVAGAFVLPGGGAKTLTGAAASGAAQGAAYGFGSGEGGVAERAKSAVEGGAVGAGIGVGVRKLANILGSRAAAKAIPSNEGLRKMADAAYETADRAGVIFRPEGLQRLTGEITQDLAAFGYHPKLQPRVGVVLDELQRVSQEPITLKGMDVLRRIAKSASASNDASERALGQKIVGKIDDFIVSASPDEMLAGDAKGAQNALIYARSLWGRMRKSEMADVALLKAERRAASTGAGGNADNAMRQNIRGLLDNPKTARGMTKAEKAAAEKVVRGTLPQNALRLAGKLAPTGAVSGVLSSGAGYGLAGPIGLALPLVGAGAKALADKMTVRNVQKLSEIIRTGGYTAQDLARFARQNRLPLSSVLAIEKLEKTYQNRLAQIGATMTAPQHKPLELTVTPGQ